MGVKFGEIDSSQILENEYRIGVLEQTFDWLMKNNSELNRPDKAVMDSIRTDALCALQKKYPNSGIKLKGEV